jgi:hypothetical protein
MYKFILSFVAAVMFTVSATAETLVLQYPGNPGKGGTAFWGDTVMAELNAKLEKYGHTIVPKYLAGQRGKKSLKEYAKNGVNDPRVLVIAHGGNGEAYLLEDIGGFDYRKYAPVLVMNTDIWVSINSSADFKNQMMTFPKTGGTGFAADMVAVGLIMCGPDQTTTVDDFIACTDERLRFIKGFGGSGGHGDRRIAFNNGQLDSTRDTPQTSMRFYQDGYDSGKLRVWFAHGIVDSKNGGVGPDINAPVGVQSFPEVYESVWGVAPSGIVYDAYVAFQGYRDGFQKTIWTAPNSPYLADLNSAIADLFADKEAMARLDKKLGKFEWLAGDDVNAHSDYLLSLVTEDRLNTLVELAQRLFGYSDAYVKTELLK